jgi:transposase
LDRTEVAVPQTHRPGAEAEVDFGEFYATVAGVVLKLWMFVMRLSHSGKAFHVAFTTQAQEAFLEGHVLALAHFGAVPGRIRYENVPRNIFVVLWPAELCGEACIGRRRRVFVGGLRGT